MVIVGNNRVNFKYSRFEVKGKDSVEITCRSCGTKSNITLSDYVSLDNTISYPTCDSCEIDHNLIIMYKGRKGKGLEIDYLVEPFK